MHFLFLQVFFRATIPECPWKWDASLTVQLGDFIEKYLLPEAAYGSILPLTRHYDAFWKRFKQLQTARQKASSRPGRGKKNAAAVTAAAAAPLNIPFGWTKDERTRLRGNHPCSCYISKHLCSLGKFCSSALGSAPSLCQKGAFQTFNLTGEARRSFYKGNFFLQENLKFCRLDMVKYIIPANDKFNHQPGTDLFPVADPTSVSQYISVDNTNALQCCHCMTFGRNGSHKPRGGDMEAFIPPPPPSDAIFTYIFAPTQHNFCDACIHGDAENMAALEHPTSHCCFHCLTPFKEQE